MSFVRRNISYQTFPCMRFHYKVSARGPHVSATSEESRQRIRSQPYLIYTAEIRMSFLCDAKTVAKNGCSDARDGYINISMPH